jgi:hypothetical protein
MYRNIHSSSALIAALLLIAVPTVLGQTGGSAAAGGDVQESIDILYTGRLLGYYRLPETQSGNSKEAFSEPFQWCLDARTAVSPQGNDAMSAPAHKFWETLQIQQYNHRSDRVLLGTGDNFALELPARVFKPNPAAGSSPSQSDAKAGWFEYSKDQFNWDWDRGSDGRPLGWVRDGQDSPKEKYILRNGFQVIPTDNVACFLAYAGYDAIVPGRHDFYYGPERVRSLARLLASMDDDKFHRVQMLAANLLIKTSWISGHNPIPDSQKPLLPFDVAKEENISFPKDGSEVLPWLSRIEVQAKLEKGSEFRVVLMGPEKDPDKDSLSVQNSAGKNVTQLQLEAGEACFEGAVAGEIPGIHNEKKKMCPVSTPGEGNKGDRIDGLTCQERPDQQNATPDNTLMRCFLNPVRPLAPGNYKVCMWPSKADSSRPQCSRFTVAVPFLQYPDPDADSDVQTEKLSVVRGEGTFWQQYTTPRPYLIKKVCARDSSGKCTGQLLKVAVFGVVDTDLAQQVGEINGSWLATQSGNPDGPRDIEKQHKMAIKTTDAAKAVKQLVDYWEDCLAAKSGQNYCYDDYRDVERVSYKVLLAQMSPERASQLTAQLKRRYHFDVVITDHDPEQFTRDQVTILDATLTSGKTPNRDVDCPIDPKTQLGLGHCNVPSFIVVPPPAWDEPWRLEDPARLLRLTTLENNRMEYLISGVQRVKTGSTLQLRQAAKELLPDHEWEVRQRPSTPQRHLALTACLGDLKEDDACNKLHEIARKVLEKTVGPRAKVDADPEEALRQATLATLLKSTHADVAMLQKIDFWFGGELTPCLLKRLHTSTMPDKAPALCQGDDQDTLQKLLDIILWKGDSFVVLPVRGSVLQAVMKRSGDYNSADNSGLSPEDDRGRGVLTLGIQGASNNYSINDMPLDPNRVYSVVTTDYIGSGDTAYPDFNDPSVNPPRPFFGKKFTYISSAVCKQYRDGNTVPRCSSTVNSEDYFDVAALLKPEPLPGNTWPHQVWMWWPFRRSPGQGHPGKNSQKETLIAPERWAQEYPMWRISLDKASLGFSIQRHSDTQAEINANFGGVATSQALAPTSHNWTTDVEMTFLRSYSSVDLVFSPQLLYAGTFTEAKQGGFRNPSQSVDTLSLDSGFRFHLFPPKRVSPHWSLDAGLHFEIQPFAIVQSLSLPSNSLPLQFELPRTYTRLGRIGIGKYDRKSYFQVGLQGGGQFGAFKEFDFPGTPVTCAPSATQTLQQCVSAKADGVIKPNSQVKVLQESRYRTGVFWHSLLVFPAGQRVSASLENQGQFFFNNSGDNSTDTRLQHLMTTKISFLIWQAISISPTYQFFFYENKLAYKSLWQQQAQITIDYKFDWTNRRIARSQLEYKSAQSSQK